MNTLIIKRGLVAFVIAFAIAFTLKVTGVADKMQALGEKHPVPGFAAKR